MTSVHDNKRSEQRDGLDQLVAELRDLSREDRDLAAWFIHRTWQEQKGERPWPKEIADLQAEVDALHGSESATEEEKRAGQRRLNALYRTEYEADRAQGKHR